MESKKDFSTNADKDETLVTPRFDSDEAETARPVVPLAAVSGEAETYDAAAYNGSASVPPGAARRSSWPLALVLVSALAGSVLGGAGLYLFQKSRQQSAAQTEQTSGANDAAGQINAPPVSEATPAPSPSREETGALAADLPEEVAETPVVAAAVTAVKEEKKEREDADRKREEPERERIEAEPARPARSEKRGKKGERDDNVARESRPRRVTEESDDSSADDDGGEYYRRGEARRIDSIVYGREGRRQRRRRGRQPSVDRVRGIFEGQP